MNKFNLRFIKIITSVIYILLLQQTITAQTFPTPLSAEGGVDTHVYKNDTVLMDAIVIDDGINNVMKRNFSIGLSMLHSPYLSMVYIPIKYGLNDNISLSLSLPFITKTIVYQNNDYIKSGYGDTMFGITYSVKPLNLFATNTTARITLPTGNVNSQDFNYDIPLGYGGYTLSIQESLSSNFYDFQYFKLRGFISGIYIHYFSSSLKNDSTTNYSFDNARAWSISTGVDFNIIDDMDILFKLNYISICERKYDTTTSTSKIDANDSIKQLNLMPFVKYLFNDNITGQFGLIFPVMTNQDDTVNQTYKPKWKIVMMLEKRFGSGTASSEGSIQNNSETSKNDINIDRKKKPKKLKK